MHATRARRFAAGLLCLAASTAPLGAVAGDSALQDTLQALDDAVFDSFNRCSDPQQLARHASYFDEGVEFYHDTGGVTWTREAMLANTRAHACGRYTRQRVDGTLQVYPVAGFGAIVQGQHRFCTVGSSTCEGLADFTMLWRHRDGQWQVTRVLSYGHRPQPAASPAGDTPAAGCDHRH